MRQDRENPVTRPRATASEPAIYDRFAWLYDFAQKYGLYLLGALGRYSYDDFARKLVSVGAIAPGSHVLDAGCGTGYLLSAVVAAVGPAGQVVGIDFSSGQLRRARAKAVGLGHSSVRLHLARIEDAPSLFSPDAFDAVYCVAVLPVLLDSEAALRAMVGVLKPGGRLVMWTICAEALPRARFRWYWHWAIRAYGLRYYTQPEIARLLEACGCEEPTFESDALSLIVLTRKKVDQ